jgi:hypothetical protein
MNLVGDISILQHNYDASLPGVLNRDKDVCTRAVWLGDFADNGKPGGRF